MDDEQKYIGSYLDYFTEKERTSEYIKSKMGSKNFNIYYSKTIEKDNGALNINYVDNAAGENSHI